MKSALALGDLTKTFKRDETRPRTLAAEQQPLVSAIIINFDGARFLPDCLSTLVSQTYPNLEVLVADNGSTDASADVTARYPVRWEPLGRNCGFALGNNLGAERANGEILVFVNNDMRFDPRFIEALVEPFLHHSDVFSTDARQLDWSGQHEIHLASRLRRSSLSETVRGSSLLPGYDLEQVAVSSSRDVVQACAGNMAARRSMFEELGGFDPAFPAGWEDTDICWRAWLHGWRTVFVPQAACWHRVSMSSVLPAGAWFRYRGAVGGRILFAAKHLPPEAALLTGASLVAGGIRELIRGKPAVAWRRLQVFLDFGRLLPSALSARWRIYKAAGTTPRRHLRRLSAIGWSHPKYDEEVGPPGRA